MKSIRDTLYLITCYSIKSGFLVKAEKYSEKAILLFPQDIRLIETRAMSLLLMGNFQEAEDLANSVAHVTWNLAYIKVRTSILLGMSTEERGERTRVYLEIRGRTLEDTSKAA